MERRYPLGDREDLIKNTLLIDLPALRHLDLGMNYGGGDWPSTTMIVPLVYMRLVLQNLEILVKLMSTSPLSDTLRQLHVQVHHCIYSSSFPASISALSVEMINLHTLTLIQYFFSKFSIEWTHFELLTSSKVMPALRRANIALLMSINDLSRIRSAPIFIDHRRVEVNFAFSVINCPQYDQMTQFIPCGGRFHTREIVGVTFVVNKWIDRSKWSTNIDPYVSSHSMIFMLRFSYQAEYTV